MNEEDEDCPIGRKGDGHGFTRCDLHRLPGETGKTVTGLYYAELLRRRNAENTAPFGEEKSASPT